MQSLGFCTVDFLELWVFLSQNSTLFDFKEQFFFLLFCLHTAETVDNNFVESWIKFNSHKKKHQHCISPICSVASLCRRSGPLRSDRVSFALHEWRQMSECIKWRADDEISFWFWLMRFNFTEPPTTRPIHCLSVVIETVWLTTHSVVTRDQTLLRVEWKIIAWLLTFILIAVLFVSLSFECLLILLQIQSTDIEFQLIAAETTFSHVYLRLFVLFPSFTALAFHIFIPPPLSTPLLLWFEVSLLGE